MRVLLCSTCINALGETFTLAIFARELMSEGVECYFIAPKLGRDYLMTFGFDERNILCLPSVRKADDNYDLTSNYESFKPWVDSVKPDVIIVADWHHYDKNGLSNNRSYMLDWFDDKMPMVTFDHLGFAPDGVSADHAKVDDLMNDKVRRDFFVKDYMPMSDRFSSIIRPCPHHHNGNRSQGNIFYWGIYKDSIPKVASCRGDICAEFECHGSKIIFQPLGLWQERMITTVFKHDFGMDYNYHIDTFLPIFTDYLAHFDQPFVYILISSIVKTRRVFRSGNTKVVILPPLKHNDFMRYLNSADLFLTDNLMSSNLGKAVFNNIPSMTLRSSLYIDKEGEINSPYTLTEKAERALSTLKQHGMIFPYYSFPLGLCELGEMYRDNNFTSCFEICEAYDEDECVGRLGDLLFDKRCIDKQLQNQNSYIQNNKKLLSASEIVRNCM